MFFYRLLPLRFRLQFRGLQPDLDRMRQMVHSVGQDGLGIVGRVQAGRLSEKQTGGIGYNAQGKQLKDACSYVDAVQK